MLSVGTYLADRYEIIDKIGAGGMSDVYKAKDHILERFVAIKVLKAEFSEDRNFVSKFRSEAQSAAGLEHPNIVNIYDVGSEEGLYFIVMEYVEGITLKTYIEKKSQLSFKEATSIAIQVARGIEAAHNKKITHRDIKPQNIMISTAGKVKVTDFGIARAASSNTISSDVMGSVHYSSPEQTRNGFVDGRSDIYSLGIVMYEMVTGRVPFDGDTTVAVAIQHLQEDMVEPRAFAKALPISLEKIIMKCTQKNPDRRYQTIVELLADLRTALTNPDEDFVVIAPAMDNGATKIINDDELKQIKERGTEGVAATEVVETVSEVKKSSRPASKTNTAGKVSTSQAVEEDEDDENGLSPKLDKAITITGIVVLAIILIMIVYLLGGVFGLFRYPQKVTNPNDSQTQVETQQTEAKNTQQDTEVDTQAPAVETVEMISVVNMSKDAAEQQLNSMDLYMFIIAVQKSDKAEGTVLGQDVSEGTQIAKGSTVNVIVAGAENIDYSNSTGTEEKVVVQNVLGYAEAEAVKVLEGQNLRVVKEYEFDETVEAGKVISQTPEGGSEVWARSTVNILVSRGPKAVIVQDVVGETEANAFRILEDLGLIVEVEEVYDDEVAAGFVIDQSIRAEKTVPAGTTITLTVSIGEEENPQEEVWYSFYGEYPVPEGAVSVQYTLIGADGEEYLSGTEDVRGTLSLNMSDIECATGTLTLTWTIVSVDEEGLEDNSTLSETIPVEFSVQ